MVSQTSTHLNITMILHNCNLFKRKYMACGIAIRTTIILYNQGQTRRYFPIFLINVF